MRCSNKRLLFAVLAIVVLVVGKLAPCPSGMTEAGKATISVLAFIIVLWLGDVMPKSVACLIAMVVMPWVGAAESFKTVIAGFITEPFFFLMSAFALASVIQASTIPRRLMILCLNTFKNNSKLIVLGFMICTALISTVMSDLAACALFASIAMAVFSKPDFQDENSKRLARCVMMGISSAALAGGIMTPVGSPTNITLMSLAEQYSDMSVSFLQWMMVGVPIGVIAVAMSWFGICISVRPKNLSVEKISMLRESLNNFEPLTPKEKKMLVLVASMFLAWCLSGIFGFISSTAVAIIGMVLMFAPGLDLLTWEQYQKDVPWDILFMLGGLMAVALCLQDSGVISWLIGNIMSGAETWDPTFVLLAISFVIMTVRTFLPSGPPIIVLATPAFIALAHVVGLNPFCVVIAASIWCQITYIVPAIDALHMITYSKGYFKIMDMIKFGIPLTVVLLVLFTLIIPPLVAVVGID